MRQLGQMNRKKKHKSRRWKKEDQFTEQDRRKCGHEAKDKTKQTGMAVAR